jgi:uncharacterized protein YkwD
MPLIDQEWLDKQMRKLDYASMRKKRAKRIRLIVLASVAGGIIIVLAFAFMGVEPLATYKDGTITELKQLWDSASSHIVEKSVEIKSTASKAVVSTISSDIQDYITRFNEYREEMGCQALIFTDELNAIAAKRLTEIKVDFSHYSPGQYNLGLGENIAENKMIIEWVIQIGSLSNQQALEQWEASPSHNANMLDKSYRYSGYAIGGGYAVQVFE